MVKKERKVKIISTSTNQKIELVKRQADLRSNSVLQLFKLVKPLKATISTRSIVKQDFDFASSTKSKGKQD